MLTSVQLLTHPQKWKREIGTYLLPWKDKITIKDLRGWALWIIFPLITIRIYGEDLDLEYPVWNIEIINHISKEMKYRHTKSIQGIKELLHELNEN